jgi:methionine-rich copper-binding protein CopC
MQSVRSSRILVVLAIVGAMAHIASSTARTHMRIVKAPQNQTVVEYAPVTFECEVLNATRLLDVYWTRQNRDKTYHTVGKL